MTYRRPSWQVDGCEANGNLVDVRGVDKVVKVFEYID